MFLNNGFVRAIVCIGLVLSMFMVAFADTIRLKNGSIIKGRITGFSGGKFTIAVGDGSRRREFSFDADEVESIVFSGEDAPSTASSQGTSVREVVINSPRPGADRGSNPRVITSDTTRPTATATPRPAATPSPTVQPTPRQIPAVSTRTPPSTTRQSPSVLPGKPVELNVKVLADNTANGWTNSGWVVKRGQKIKITGNGEVSLGRGRMSTAAGLYEVEDGQKLMPNVPTGALLAVIGDDNNEFIYIGLEREIIAERDGILFLGINEGNLNDNSGSLDVKIEISVGS